jgi:hypothetical protein
MGRKGSAGVPLPTIGKTASTRSCRFLRSTGGWASKGVKTGAINKTNVWLVIIEEYESTSCQLQAQNEHCLIKPYEFL